jgi:hypothetical protein
MAVGLHLAPRSLSASDEPDTADAIRQGIVVVSLVLAVVPSTRLSIAAGLVESADAPRRGMLALAGAFFVVTGNRFPKTLTPLAALKCHPARVQAFRRAAGWTWVLMGLAFAFVWLVLPLGAARAMSVMLLVSGVLGTGWQIVRLRAARREA